MREVSERRLDDPEKKINERLDAKSDNRSFERKQTDNRRIYDELFDEEAENETDVKNTENDFKASIRVVEDKKQGREISSIESQIRLLEEQYLTEQKQFDEEFNKLIEQRKKLQIQTDKEMMQEIQRKMKQILEAKRLATTKHKNTISKIQATGRLESEFTDKTQGLRLTSPVGSKQEKGSMQNETKDYESYQISIDGKKVEYRKDKDGSESWYINGEEMASKKTTRYDITRKETTPNYKKSFVEKDGIKFPVMVRIPELDTTLEEVTLLYEGEKLGTITKTDVPLLDITGDEEKVIGRQLQTETIRKDFRSTKTISTFEDSQDRVEQVAVIDKDKTIRTNSINGKPVFKMEKSDSGTIITRYSSEGDVLAEFHYNKDGYPIDTIEARVNGKIENVPMHYPGIKKIPYMPEAYWEVYEKGSPELKECDAFLDKISDAGIPRDIKEKLENSIPKNHEKNAVIRQAKSIREKGIDISESEINIPR